MSDTKKKKKKTGTGLLILMAVAGSGLLGYLIGRIQGGDAEQGSSRIMQSRIEEPDYGFLDDEPFPEETQPAAAMKRARPPGPDAIVPKTALIGIPSDELLQAVQAMAGSADVQNLMVGLVATASHRGKDMYPELATLLREGVDAKLATKDGKGHPTLRVALMEAALATGDPEAVKLVAEVAQTTESTVEVIFSTHLLDRMDELDANTAQRAIDTLGNDISKEEMQAIAPVLRQVIPAAAGADPAYAE